MTRIDHEVTNRRGVVLYTSPDKDLARTWAKANASRHDGVEVFEVTRTELRRRVYRPALRLVASS